MTKLSDRAAADAAADGFHAAISALVRSGPGMTERRGAAGTRLEFTGVPVAMLNYVAPGTEPDLGEVDALAGELAAMGAQWSIVTRGEAGSGLRAVGARHGRVRSASLPLLVWDAEQLPALPEAAVPGATVREISGRESHVFAAALAEGMGIPRDTADMLSAPALCDAPGMTAFVLDVNGEAVATGFNVIVGDQVGLFNGSVPPKHRRNGYYRALVIARLRRAIDAGARYAFTQNSAMSRPLYESLGFRHVEDWTYLVSGS